MTTLTRMIWPSAITNLAPFGARMHLHHDAAMRTTIDIPEDLHHILSSLAMHRRSTLSATATELMRRALAAPAANPAGAGIGISERTGLPWVRAARVISANDVHALEDE